MRTQGFTLVEQLTVLAILAIVFATGSTALQDLSRRAEARSSVLKVDRMLSHARHAALGRQMAVAVCSSHDGIACNGRWDDGLLVFLDPRQSGQPQRPENILGHERLDTRGELRWRGFGGSIVALSTVSGAARPATAASPTAPTTAAPSLHARSCSIGGGRIRHSRDRDGDGIHDDSSGNPLIC